MHEAKLWKLMSDDKIQCRLCCHYCIIDNQSTGLCGVRVNQNSKLYTKVYDKVAALNVDPIEKKPLYHFLPGTNTFSFGTQGCNFGCEFCQNASLSQPTRQGKEVQGHFATPEMLVDAALEHDCKSISYTYSEPTIFYELMLDTAKLAHQRGLRNILISNGYQSNECLNELYPYIDAANIDLKAFSQNFYTQICKGKLQPVLDNIKKMKKAGWWLEITTLLIPDKNDSKDELTKQATFIADQLGINTPWHLSRFHPDYMMKECGITPMKSLQLARKIGKEAGLSYVYIGNVPGNEHSSTFCPECNSETIKRLGFEIKEVASEFGMCKYCGCNVDGIFE